MSYIDTIPHSFIGFFLDRYQTYHPLDNLPNDNITPNNIVIGGGSGEHPMLVIENIYYCVECYIRECVFKANPVILELIPHQELLNELIQYYPIISTNLRRIDWSKEQIKEFRSEVFKFNKKYNISDKEDRIINILIGEFIVNHCVELLDSSIVKVLNEIHSRKDIKFFIKYNAFPKYEDEFKTMYGRKPDTMEYGYTIEDEMKYKRYASKIEKLKDLINDINEYKKEFTDDKFLDLMLNDMKRLLNNLKNE